MCNDITAEAILAKRIKEFYKYKAKIIVTFTNIIGFGVKWDWYYINIFFPFFIITIYRIKKMFGHTNGYDDFRFINKSNIKFIKE